MTIHNPQSKIQNQTISLIAAMAENRAIGHHNKLPWHLPADLKRFKQLTTGHAVIMGRKTFESIGCKPLPNRRNIVITRNPQFKADSAQMAHDLDEALSLAEDDREVFILGGAEIYRLALPRADRIYLTVVHGTFEGDAFFPEFDAQKQWKLREETRHDADERNACAMSFQMYERAARRDK